MSHAIRLCAAVAATAAACQQPIGDIDGAFYDGDGRGVHCAVDLDSAARNDLASIDSALDRARDDGVVAELYAHDPGRTVPVAVIEHVLAGASARGLGFFTYADFAAGDGRGPGLALSFDDDSVASWTALRPMLQQYAARATFFVSRYRELSAGRRDELRALAGDGHSLAAHSVRHLRAPAYVEEFGLRDYLRDEALPSIVEMEADGFPITAYAYPFGARTDELDRALLEHVAVLRSVAFTFTGVVASPCPR